nr:uncharacterized mitochondrial protein AtMg00820-like [Tanacetum cinerariifolium]
LNDLLDDNNFFIFDDVNVRISLVSKMPFKKKPCNSIHARSKSNSNKSLPRTVHKWLPKLKPLAEPLPKWFPRIVQIFLWIIDSGCSKHMTGNRALLTNFVEKFLGTVRFGNNDFAVIVGYGDEKKTIVVTSDPLALIAKKTKLSKRKEKVIVSLNSKGSDADDFSELKRITALLAKAFNRRKFYSKPTNNNLLTLSTSQSANKKQEAVKSDDKKVEKKDDDKKRDMSKVKCYNCKKEGHFAKDCKKAKVKDYEYYKTKIDSDQEINANMVFMAQIEKIISDSEASSSFVDDKISEQTSSLKPYIQTVILEKIIIDLEDTVSLLEKEKENLKTIESLKSKDVETGVESNEKVVYETENKSENDCQVIEKVCDSEENPNLISPGMFKLSVSQSVSPISMTKMSCASNGVENKLKRKRQKRTSSKKHDKKVNKDVLRANKDFVHFSDLDTLSSVRRPKPSSVMWMRKGSSNTIKADLSSVNHSNLNKKVKRYSRKNLMACNNFDTRSAFDCNNARNALCNARMNASVDVNDLFVFDDVSIRKSHVSKMPFRKKPSASLNVPYRNKLNKSLPRNVCTWLPKLKPLAEPIAKWIPRVTRHIDKISKTPNSPGPIYKWVPKFLGTVRFGNNDFAVIAGYGDVVIGSMTIKKVYYVSAMQEELDQFTRLKVWRLVPRPEGKTTIKTKWIFKIKKDESSLVIRNKSRLVAVGYSQQKVIDHDETFAPVAQIEAIRLFLAYAAHKDFTVF